MLSTSVLCTRPKRDNIIEIVADAFALLAARFHLVFGLVKHIMKQWEFLFFDLREFTIFVHNETHSGLSACNRNQLNISKCHESFYATRKQNINKTQSGEILHRF